MEIAMIIVKALTAMVGWTAFAVIVAIAALSLWILLKIFLTGGIGVESLNFRVL